jgi:hypothetical protein
MKRILLFIIALLTLSLSLSAGSFLALNSFGKYNIQGDIRSFSMGGTGVALADEYNTSLINPALAATKDRIYLNIGETFSSHSMDYARFSDFGPSGADFDMPYMNIIFPLPVKGVALSAHYYSPVNSGIELHYNASEDDYVEEVHYKNINFVEFGAAWRILPSLSAGAGVLYAFGNERNEYTIVNEEFVNDTTYNKWKYTYSGVGYHIGLLYQSSLFGAGISYHPSFDISVSRSFNDAKIPPDTEFTYPAQWTAGISVTPGEWTFTGEFSTADWSVTQYHDYPLEKMSRYSVGAEYDLKIPYKRHGNLKTFDIPVRLGYYSQTGFYQEGKEWGLTGGLSLFPFKSVSSARMDLFLSYGQRETLLEDHFEGGKYGYQENFFTIGISFSATDKWYK